MISLRTNFKQKREKLIPYYMIRKSYKLSFLIIMLNTMKKKFVGLDKKWKNIKWRMKKTSINSLLLRTQGNKLRLFQKFVINSLKKH